MNGEMYRPSFKTHAEHTRNVSFERGRRVGVYDDAAHVPLWRATGEVS